MQYKLNPAITEKELRDYGFTDFSNGHWYYYQIMYNEYRWHMSFNLDVLKSNYNHIEIDIIDDITGKVFNFKYMTDVKKKDRTVRRMKRAYDKIIKKLLNDKILLEV